VGVNGHAAKETQWSVEILSQSLYGFLNTTKDGNFRHLNAAVSLSRETDLSIL